MQLYKKAFFLLIGIFVLAFVLLPFKPLLAQSDDTCPIDKPSANCDKKTDLKEQTSGGEIKVYFFFAPGCAHCEKVEASLKDLALKYSLGLEIVNAKANGQKLRTLLHNYNVPITAWGKVPITFVGDKYFQGVKSTSEIENIIKDVKNRDKITPLNQGINEVGTIKLLQISILALTDSINPCALAIFLLLLLTLVEEKNFAGKKIFIPALSFISAIFISYFLLGLLIVLGFKGVSSFNFSITFWLYKATAILAIALGLLGLWEFFKTKNGVCKTTRFFGLRINNVLNRTFSPMGMFIAGILISIFLLPCSSGPYFVASGLLFDKPILQALPWLSYYNLLFILPMVLIVLIIAFALIEVDKINQIVAKNSRLFTLIDALFLIALGLWVIFF